MLDAKTEIEDRVSLICSTCRKSIPDGSLKSKAGSWLFRDEWCSCSITPGGNFSLAPIVNPAGSAEDAEPCSDSGAQGIDVDLGDRYQVLGRLGSGANAVAYKVHDRELDKTLAVKILRPELIDDSAARKRFKLEAEAASNLTHANIVSIYSHGTAASNAPYLVMDCLEGETLESLLQRETRLNLETSLDIFIQICEGLSHMHMKGIVHRDIKPSNIFVTSRGDQLPIVKLVDFGIAKTEYASDTTHFTQIGEVIGSPPYMSPEQCRGDNVDARSDIYSLGCVMFEALTGRPPFVNDTAIKLVLDHVSTPPPALRRYCRGRSLPDGLEQLIMHCLEKNPAGRYQSIDQLGADLRSLRDNGKVAVSPCSVLPPIWKRYLAGTIDGAILGVVASVIMAVFMFSSHTQPSLETVLSFIGTPGFLSWLLIALEWSGICRPGSAFAVFIVNVIWLGGTHSPTGPPSVDDCLRWNLCLIIPMLAALIYFPCFESSALRATPGKFLMGLLVVGRDGRRLKYINALRRWFTRTLYIPRSRRRGENILRFIRDWLYLLRLTELDQWAGGFVIERKALNNPYVPNLEQHLIHPDRRARDIIHDAEQSRSTILTAMAFVLGSCLFLVSQETLRSYTFTWMLACVCMLAPSVPFFFYTRARQKEYLQHRKDTEDQRFIEQAIHEVQRRD